jgi:NADH-quinone oxidoreductase subunit J
VDRLFRDGIEPSTQGFSVLCSSTELSKQTKVSKILLMLVGVIGGILMLKTRNPVHSVLSLIIVFISVTAIMILKGGEFIGIIVLIVYVGAIAVLFLFIVMMLNIKIIEKRDKDITYIPIGIGMGIILYIEIIGLMRGQGKLEKEGREYIEWMEKVLDQQSIEQIGEILYIQNIDYIIEGSLILLVGMIGSISLTYKENKEVKKQKIGEQITREYKKVVREIRKRK